MNYLDAKTVLLETSPRIPLRMMVIEAATLVCVAGILVRIFA